MNKDRYALPSLIYPSNIQQYTITHKQTCLKSVSYSAMTHLQVMELQHFGATLLFTNFKSAITAPQYIVWLKLLFLLSLYQKFFNMYKPNCTKLTIHTSSHCVLPTSLHTQHIPTVSSSPIPLYLVPQLCSSLQGLRLLMRTDNLK